MTAKRPVESHRLFDTMLSRRRAAKWLAAGTALGVAGALTGRERFAAAQGATPAASPAAALNVYPQVTIIAQDFSFGAPATLPTGYTRVTLVNSSPDMTHHAMFMQLNSGVTPDQFEATAKSSTNVGALFALAKSVGGPGSIDPSQNSTVIMNLAEGSYVLICAIPGPGGKPHYQLGMMAAVQAQASGTPVTTEPTADATVDLVDFKFDGLPATVPAGQHIWKVMDTGHQVHEMAIFALAPGVSADQFLAILTASVAPPAASPAASPAATPVMAATPVAGPPPLVDVAGVAPMNPGETNWAVLDLQPGNYAAVCFVPDPATGKPHFELGMHMAFNVQ